jgi:hypothetical protein
LRRGAGCMQGCGHAMRSPAAFSDGGTMRSMDRMLLISR